MTTRKFPRECFCSRLLGMSMCIVQEPLLLHTFPIPPRIVAWKMRVDDGKRCKVDEKVFGH